MNYPFWDVPHLGGGWVIGLIAIFHVMVSHFAIGGGFYLVLAETKARRENRPDWLRVLQGHSKFFLILTGVFGAATGVAIWFAIGLANPEATSALIHNFVFAWAIEWVFFMVELTTAAVYYYTWNRIPDSLHLKVGWVYAIASFFTLFIDGVKLFVINILYLIVPVIAGMITFGYAILGIISTGGEFSMESILPIIGGVFVGLLITLIIAIIFGLLGIIGAVRFARTGSMAEAFAIGEIIATIGRIGWINYILSLIVIFVVIFVIMIALTAVELILGIIPLLGVIIGWILSLAVSPFISLLIARFYSLLYDEGE